MANPTLRLVKGSPLTNAELDANFSGINTDVLALQTAVAGKAPAQHTHVVTDIVASGTRDGTTVLHGDGSWKTPAAASGGATILDQLTDVVITTPAAGQSLRHNGAVFVNTTLGTGDISGLDAALSAKAALASPSLTGTPTAPVAAVDTNTAQLATTSFVLSQAAAVNPLVNGTVAIGTSTRFARADHVHPTDSTRAPLASPSFSGTPTAPTATSGTNTTQLATTAYVQTALSSITGTGGATTLDGLTDVIISSPTTTQVLRYNGTAWVNASSALDDISDVVITSPLSGHGIRYNGTNWINAAFAVADVAGAAPLASPAFTGTPTAPTAAADTNTTQLATTGFYFAQKGTATPAANGTAAAGASSRWAAIDHVHPTDTSRQAADATLTALSALTGAGIPVASGTDVFVMRALGVTGATDIPDRAAADTRYALLAAFDALAARVAALEGTVDATGSYVVTDYVATDYVDDGTPATGGGSTYTDPDYVIADYVV